jgi:hypothetical protein
VRQPLEGLRVLELAEGVAGPYAGKLFADLGADVVKLEPPGGDRSRRFGVVDAPAGMSSAFIHLNTNKRSMVADLATDAGVDLAMRLAVRSDLVIESFTDGRAVDVGRRRIDIGARSASWARVTACCNSGATATVARSSSKCAASRNKSPLNASRNRTAASSTWNGCAKPRRAPRSTIGSGVVPSTPDRAGVRVAVGLDVDVKRGRVERPRQAAVGQAPNRASSASLSSPIRPGTK